MTSMEPFADDRTLSKMGSVVPMDRTYGQARRTSRPTVRTGFSGAQSGQAHATPPETPVSLQAEGESPNDPHALFHNYLRAFYPFDSLSNTSTLDESLLVTASISPGDLILVHSVHANGWADGTVLTTGERGWLPTNYCEAFDHPYLRSLLNAMTQFWDLLGANEDANLSAFVRQDYIRGLIAGVRYLLEHADCLHRDAALVQRNTGIRRMRKGLLADLSSLVQIAKRMQETISEPFAGEVIHVLLEDLIAKAFKVVTRAVGFVDIWTQEASNGTEMNGHRESAEPCKASLEFETLAIDTQTPQRDYHKQPVDSAKSFPAEIGIANGGGDAKAGAEADAYAGRDRSGSLNAALVARQGSVAHRLSLVTDSAKLGVLASERLARLHDLCISHIGAFIGHHLQSRSSTELRDTTDRLVVACKSMLAIVDEVYSHDTQRSVAIQQARINFQLKLEELTKVTRDVFRFSDSEDDDVFMLPEQSSNLVHVGTSLIRTAGECVIKTRSLIEQIGDFEIDSARETSERATTVPGDADEDTSTYRSSPVKTYVQPERHVTSSFERRLSKKMLPPPPPIQPHSLTATDTFDFALNESELPTPASPIAHASQTSLRSLPSSIQRRSALRISGTALQSTDSLRSPRSFRTSSISPGRKGSVGVSIAGSAETYRSSARDSGISHVSEVSTRATTPDPAKESSSPDAALLNSFGSLSSIRSSTTDTDSDAETRLLQRTYASELTLNKDGQVSGGSLPALVEQLTTHDSAPDPQFVSAFYITFRMFTSPRDLAQALITRFEYVGDGKEVGTPVRLRIYNVFKGWLETYWDAEADKVALGDIRYFALHKLRPHLPSAGERLVELTRKVTTGYHTGTITGPLVSGVGKTSTSIGTQYDADANIPEPVITKSQLSALRAGGTSCSILDFDALELARQFTLMTSKIFCDIQPQELLSLEWGRKNTQKARNVRSMCTINTDLAHVVGDTVLTPEDAKKRALVIKQWSKVGMHCLALNNYDSLMAIMCSLNSTVVQRLRRTWELVSKKTKTRLSELNTVVDYSRNQASLRRRLESPTAPCLPFLGIYLTDLTFVDAGNPKTRELPGRASENGETVSVINFDKHMRMAKIISHLQKFQVPYKLQPVPEMQTWMDMHLQRMRQGNDEMVGNLHRRSLVVEPKLEDVMKSVRPAEGDERPKTAGGKERLEMLFKSNTFSFMQMSRTEPPTPTAETVEEVTAER